MKLPPNVETWWTGQGGEIARREMTWARGWVFSREGGVLVWSLVIFQSALYISIFLLSSATGSSLSPGSSSSAPSFGIATVIFPLIVVFGSIATLILQCVLFVRLLRLRIWPLFDRHRLGDTLLTGMDGPSLWPGLLVAPALIWGGISIVPLFLGFILGLISLATTGESSFSSVEMLKLSTEGELRPILWHWMTWGQWTLLPLQLLLGIVGATLPFAIAARFTLMNPGTLRALIFGAGGTVLMALPGVALVVPNMIPGYMPDINQMVVIQTVALPPISALWIILILWITLRSLRGPKLWEKLRASAESV